MSVIDRVTERRRVADVKDAHDALDRLESLLDEMGQSEIGIMPEEYEAIATVRAALPAWVH